MQKDDRGFSDKLLDGEYHNVAIITILVSAAIILVINLAKADILPRTWVEIGVAIVVLIPTFCYAVSIVKKILKKN